MNASQKHAKDYGYVETILGRRRHIPDMQLPKFEFVAEPGYMNPDIDPLDIDTLDNKETIPSRIIDQLTKEFESYKYFGQIVKRTKELKEQHIKVINNTRKITDASRKCVNCVDYQTEILTTSGWKRYEEVSVGTEILSYSMDSHQIVRDTVNAVLNYPDVQEVVEFDTPTFSAVSTMNHRWVVGESDEVPKIKFTHNIYNNKWPDYPILRVGDNSFESNKNISDDELKILGWILTDGSIGKPNYSIHLYQSERQEKNKCVYYDMVSTLANAGVDVTDVCKGGFYHEIYLKKNPFLKWVWDNFPDRLLTFDFINTLSQRQAEILMRAMLQGDGSGVDGYGQTKPNSSARICCRCSKAKDAFQYLCFIAGYATNASEIDNSKVDYPSNHIQYDSMSNIPNSNSVYYEVSVLRVQRAHIYPHHKSKKTVEGVWCISCNSGTWVARRNGKVYITGNSTIQGSAAEQTKLAMLLIENNQEWKDIGGRIIIPVHDELIAEVPAEYWEEGAKILSSLMCEAANFLPFPSKCDVEVSYRWYGLSYPCKYLRPNSLDHLSEEEIKWVQYHLIECEYPMPKIKSTQDEKLRGDKALGINGIESNEFVNAINEYIDRYNITRDEFIDHIETKVNTGHIPARRNK